MSITELGEGQRLHPLTLVEPTNQQTAGTSFDLTDFTNVGPTRAEAVTLLGQALPELFEALPEGQEYWDQAGRIIAVLLHRNVNQNFVNEALEACAALYDLRMGGCLVHMYGYANTDKNRDYWLDYERQNLTCAIRNITGDVPEQVAA